MRAAISTAFVDFPSQNLQINAYLAQPVAAGPWPTVIVFPEIFGVNEHIRAVTERIAQEGYVAIAFNIYQRLSPEFELGYTPAAVQLGRDYKNQTKAPELIGDTQAAIAYLKNLPKAQGLIGCISFCFGGHVAYLAATLPEIKATASFYGAGIATLTPGGGLPTVTRTAEIQGTLYGFFGLEDASIPAEQVDQIEAQLTQHQVPHCLFRYPGAGHGFFCDRRDSYHPAAAIAAWEQVKQLFQAMGGPK